VRESALRIVGYAIVSTDGMIADAAGYMPPQIINKADQQFFAAGLDAAAVVVHGRHSQDQHPQSAQRLRLVATHRIPAIAPHPSNPRARLWNPDGASLEEACAALGVTDGTAAAIGGTEVFGLFLPRYHAFHLTRAEQASLPGGRPVFPGIPPQTPEQLLELHGLKPGPVEMLDSAARVTLCTWHR
jgi:dihydrofolate reductase